MHRSVLVAAVVGIGLSAFGSFARAQDKSPFPALDYSATRVTTAPDGKQVTEKIYQAGNKIRTDPPGGKMHTVMLLDKKEIYMVMPEMCMQMTTQPNPQPSEMRGKVERTRIGTGVANGHPAIIEQITVTPSNGGKPVTMKAWEATDLKGLPVRMEIPSPEGVVRIDYKDIDLSAPPASLFAVPDNCRKMPMMPNMPHPGR